MYITVLVCCPSARCKGCLHKTTVFWNFVCRPNDKVEILSEGASLKELWECFFKKNFTALQTRQPPGFANVLWSRVSALTSNKEIFILRLYWLLVNTAQEYQMLWGSRTITQGKILTKIELYVLLKNNQSSLQGIMSVCKSHPFS